MLIRWAKYEPEVDVGGRACTAEDAGLDPAGDDDLRADRKSRRESLEEPIEIARGLRMRS